MSTWAELINLSLIEIGVLEAGEQANEDQRARAFSRLQGMLDEWSLEGLLTPSPLVITYQVTEAKQIFSIGKREGNDIVAEAPSSVLSVNYDSILYQSTDGGYRLTTINHSQWQDTHCETPGGWPSSFFYQNSWPSAQIYLNRPANIGDVMNIRGRGFILSEDAKITDEIDLPRGYEEPVTLNLAIRQASSFGVRPKPATVTLAMMGKKTLQKRNLTRPAYRAEPGMMGHNQYGGNGDFNINRV